MKAITPIVPGHELPVVVFAKDQPEYRQLPAYVDCEGCVTSRWRLTWRERLRIFWSGDLWLSVLTFGGKLQPVRLDTQCPLDVATQPDLERRQ